MNSVKKILDKKYIEFNKLSFIENDPVQIPHQYSNPEDIEIAAFLTATIAWGNRKAIIKGASQLLQMMDQCPYEFVTRCSEKEIKSLSHFKYRTFNGKDTIYFIRSLRHIYINYGGLYSVFYDGYKKRHGVDDALIYLRTIFFEHANVGHAAKHISDVNSGSAAKRLNLFLRWMVRTDTLGVDFGLWKKISPADLFIPLDVHVANTSRMLGLLTRNQNDWKAVVELTERLRTFDIKDPIKYDFSLFGMGIELKNDRSL